MPAAFVVARCQYNGRAARMDCRIDTLRHSGAFCRLLKRK
jgi:hypothetical protein